MDLRDFKAKCQFYERDGRLYGRAVIQLRDGRNVIVETKSSDGIPLALLTHRFAEREVEGDIGGLFSNVWKGAKKAATSVAKGKLAKDLLKTSVTLAKSDLGSIALSVVPYGTTVQKAVQIGTKAANLIGQVEAGSRKAKEQVMNIVNQAAAGNPAAAQAKAVLKNVLKAGKQKGVFTGKTTSPSRRGPVKVAKVVKKKKAGKAPRAASARVLTAARRAPIPFRSGRETGIFGPYWRGLSSMMRGSGGGTVATEAIGHWEQWTTP